MATKIGIVNAGNIGLTLAMSLVKAGHTVMVSKDGPHASKLGTRVEEFSSVHGLPEGDKARIVIGSIVEAARFSDDVTIFGVYFPRLAEVFKEIQAAGVSFVGRGVLIDTANPLNVDSNFNHYHDLEYMARTSTSEDLATAFPGAVVVKTFSTLPSDLLDPRRWADARRDGRLDKPTMLYVGGEKSEAGDIIDQRVRSVIKDAGFRPVSAGRSLEDARLLEKLGILLHRVSVAEFGGDLNIGFTVTKP